MKHLDFTSEVLTPLFLGGAETRVRPELRALSIRGAMRYWYRAIVGGSVLLSSTSDKERLQALKQHEADLFGTTEKSSAVAVLVHMDRPPEIETFQKDRAIRTSEGDFLPTGKDYLLWSMAASGRPGTPRYQPEREYIKPGTRFTIWLQSRTPGGDNSLPKATAALWLLANLGGLGARANRGAGSLEVEVADPVYGLSFNRCRTIDELKSYLSSGIRQCLSLVSSAETWETFVEPPNYDVLASMASEVWVVSSLPNGWGTAMEALEVIGTKLRDFRSHRSSVGRADHDKVLAWLEGGGSPPQIMRAVFGLPIPFRYSGGGPSDVIVPEHGDRRASPLRIRITLLATGRYVGVFTLFKSHFLERDKQLQLQTRKWKAPLPTDYGVIQEFIQAFEVRQEVTL